MTTSRSRSLRRRHDPRRWVVRLVMWGVPVVVSVLTLVYAHRLLASRRPALELDTRPAPSALVPDHDEEVARDAAESESSSDAERLRAWIRDRDAQRGKANAREGEIESLKQEVERLRSEAHEREAREREAREQKMAAGRRVAEPATRPESVPASQPVTAVRAAVVRPPGDASETVLPESAVEATEETGSSLASSAAESLLEEAAMHRAARNARQLLGVLKELEKLGSDDPGVYFGLGEVYGSAGACVNYAKARAAFEKFLAMTKDAKSDVTQERRQAAQRYVDLLSENHCLFLVTPLGMITKRQSKARAELGRWKKVVIRARLEISGCERYIERMRRSGHTYRIAHIQAKKRQIRELRKKITRAEKRMEFLTDELARLQEARL